jgi:hypothetical protein
MVKDRGSRVRFPAELGIFLFTTASRPALGPTQPPIQWVPGALSLGVKRPGREADQSPVSSAEVRMRGAIPPLPEYVLMAWCLVKHRDNFTFTKIGCGGEFDDPHLYSSSTFSLVLLRLLLLLCLHHDLFFSVLF